MLSSRGVQQQDCLCMQWDAHRGDCLAVGWTLGRFVQDLKLLNPQYAAQRGDCLRNMMHNMEIVSAV